MKRTLLALTLLLIACLGLARGGIAGDCCSHRAKALATEPSSVAGSSRIDVEHAGAVEQVVDSDRVGASCSSHPDEGAHDNHGTCGCGDDCQCENCDCAHSSGSVGAAVEIRWQGPPPLAFDGLTCGAPIERCRKIVRTGPERIEAPPGRRRRKAILADCRLIPLRD
ncbi:MAG: hypothetical protein H6833_11200 [Planctomycetes bacterium]|nr:hypothetical protein [Planctomycetota bacterium]